MYVLVSFERKRELDYLWKFGNTTGWRPSATFNWVPKAILFVLTSTVSLSTFVNDRVTCWQARGQPWCLWVWIPANARMCACVAKCPVVSTAIAVPTSALCRSYFDNYFKGETNGYKENVWLVVYLTTLLQKLDYTASMIGWYVKD
jgi:hypothetical protein